MNNEMGNNTKNIIIGVLVVALVAISIFMITKSRKEEPIEKRLNKNEMNLGEFQHIVRTQASTELAEEFGIDITGSEFEQYVTMIIGENTMPNDIYELPNSPNMIKHVLGEEQLKESLMPAYVEDKITKMMESEEPKKEEIEETMIMMTDYLDSLGIADEDREDYVRNIIASQSASLQVEKIYAIKYAKVIGELINTTNPSYLLDLPFNLNNLDEKEARDSISPASVEKQVAPAEETPAVEQGED